MTTISILLVDDSDEKRQAVASAIGRTKMRREFQIETAIAKSTLEAKRKLETKEFDLMVLDQYLPDREGAVVRPDGGVGLLHEIWTGSSLAKPGHVIILSEFEIFKETDIQIEEYGCAIIRYSAGDMAWKRAIQNKIQYVASLKYEGSGPNGKNTFDADFAIVTALNHPEWTFLYNSKWKWESERKKGDHREYFVTSVESDRRKLRIVGMPIKEMGLVAACAGTIALISQFRPRFVIMAGIAGGISPEVSLGDLVFADVCWNYDAGRLKEEVGGGVVFEPEVRQIAVDPAVRSYFEALTANDGYLKSVRARLSKPMRGKMARAILRPVASGSAVVRTRGVRKKIRDINRKTAALEMEIYGVYYACSNAVAPRPKFIAAKAISDHADSTQNESYRIAAACISAAGVIEVIECHGARLLNAIEVEG